MRGGCDIIFAPGSTVRRILEALTAVLARCSLDADSLAAGLDDGQRKAFEAVRELARETAAQVYLVGGPVRDALLGVPVLDLDFAVEGDATVLARMLAGRLALRQAQDERVTAHARFGTATISIEGLRVDLVTARRESYRRPGALPEVTPGSIGDDLARRDFSVNAMALPLWPPDGGVLDPLGGRDDMKAGVVRALHPLSFVDDPTRMMRAVRYEQRFGFSIQKETLDAMSSAVSDGFMDAVSGDRWRRELERILDESNPVAPLLRAVELGLLSGLHPVFGKLGMDAIAPLPGGVGPDECLAVMFSAFSKADGESVIRRLRLTGRQAAIARDTIRLKESEPQIRAAAVRASELVRLLEGRGPEAVSAWAGLTADPVVAEALRYYAGELRFVKPELSGAALVGMGVPQGPLVGDILARLRDARLDGEANSIDEEMAFARGLLTESEDGLAR